MEDQNQTPPPSQGPDPQRAPQVQQGPPPSQQQPRPGPGPYQAGPPPGRPGAAPGPYGPPPGYGQRPAYGPPPGWGGRPPSGAPDPRNLKRSKAPLVIGLVIVGFMAIVGIVSLIVAASFAPSSGGGFSFSPWGEKIALLEINGVIGEGPGYGADTAWLADQVRDWTENDSIKGMVIRVNSPGGAVSATQDLFEVIEDFKATGRPVMVSMGDIAASGGVYLAMAGDEVYANSGTLTGSVGVILSFYGYQELLNKVGLESRAIKSGEFKDIGSGARDMLPEEKALLEEMVVDVFEQFFEVVMEARQEQVRESLADKQGVPGSTVAVSEVETFLRTQCDGRIFSGRQAHDMGFIDGLMTIDEVIEKMSTDLRLGDNVTVVETRKKPVGLFGPAVKFMHSIEQRSPGNVLLEYRFSM